MVRILWKHYCNYINNIEDEYQKALTIHGEEDKYVIADAVKFEFVEV